MTDLAFVEAPMLDLRGDSRVVPCPACSQQMQHKAACSLLCSVLKQARQATGKVMQVPPDPKLAVVFGVGGGVGRKVNGNEKKGGVVRVHFEAEDGAWVKLQHEEP